MPQVLCYPRKETVKVTATKPVSVTLSGNVKNNPPYSPLTKGGHRGVRSDETGLVTVTDLVMTINFNMEGGER